MTKAFVRESDDAPEHEESSDSDIPGGRNYITPAGARRLQEELRRLKHQERPEMVRVVEWAAGNGDRSENGDYIYGKKRLREIDKRLRFLSKRLQAVEIVDPNQIKSEQVHFGATVTVRDEQGRDKTYSIVGIDEADASIGRISWVSPLAKALIKAKVGEIVTFNFPRGTQELEVLHIQYIELP